MILEDQLRAYAEKALKTECVWGVDDCTRWSADWVESRIGKSLNLPAYRSEEEGRAMIAAAGGLLSLWEWKLEENGIAETFSPKLGDVGIVELSIGDVGCIVLHDTVSMFRATKGVRFIRPREFVKAWSI